ncbi:MAG: ubiquinol-cytochrome c reductase iron-sulfur subunit [Actinomycetota bacterium]
MSPGTIALIVVAVSIAGWGLFMANIAIRRERKAALASATPSGGGSTATAEAPERPAPAPSKEQQVSVKKVPEKQRKPLTSEQLAVSRRQFLNRAWTASFLTFLGFFGMSTLSFLWPKVLGGFGTEINAGGYDDILKKVGPAGGFLPLFIPEGRFWLVYYEGNGEDVVYELNGAVESKIQALYRKCVHLGCSVPHCPTSMLFECPCHGSKYRLTGEYYGGPAPRGLDRFPVVVSGGKVSVDTGTVITGPPRGTSTWEQFAEPQGSFCVPV